MTESAEQTAARYLLGRMEEAERETFEVRFLADPELSELVAAVESDLLDDYLSGELSAEERAAVAQHLLTTPEQKKRLAAASALRDGFARSRRRAHRTWWQAAAAAAVLAAIVASALLFTTRSEDVRQPTQPPIAQGPVPAPAAVDNTAVPAPAAVPSPTSQDDPVVVTIVLSAVMTRSEGELPAATLPAEAETVRIVIGLQPGDDEFASYGVLLQTPTGEPLLESSGVRVRDDRSLAVELPASRLTAGDYEVLVDGHPRSGVAEPLGVWGFSISRP